MSVFSRSEIVEMIREYFNAEKAVLKGQSYTIAGRSLTRANLDDIRDARQEWEQRLADYDVSRRGGNSSSAISVFC